MNIITASFRPGAKHTTTVDSLAQWDYGQFLKIDGIELPDSFEAHISNQPIIGSTKPRIGTDGQVDIPDEYLESGDPVYVFIVLHYGENDGKTEYRITIPVDKRPRPSKVSVRPVEQSVISQTMAALNVAAAKAEEEAEAAEAAKESILNLAVEAVSLEPDSEATVEKTVDPETDQTTILFGIPKGRIGDKGDKGNVFMPQISSAGILSWEEVETADTPASFDIVTAVLNALPVAEEGRF